jgi:molybdopterin molybdotransferase
MRPGKPTWFGRRGTVAVFGLPGNPVSTFVNFEVFVRPHLAARSGLDWKPHPLRLRLADSFSRRGSDRVEFLPAIFVEAAGETRARPLVYKGSSMLNVLAEAELLLRIEQGTETIAEGGIVDARLLRA